MLDFFRKYQRYFFFVITVVIIISFSFFGTYETMTSRSDVWREEIAFTAVNGHDVSRFDVEEMAQFLSTEAQDKLNYGGAWGPNFLNDGVIQKDILAKGIGEELILSYPDFFKNDFAARLAKEKKYTLYSHPEARFVGVESIWTYFSPEMNGHYRSLRASSDPLNQDAIKNRIALFLGGRQIPQHTLRYLLAYQEQQYSWLKPDPNLNQIDLSLFGYHTLEDWFGPAFTRLASEFIINSAIIAESQGYRVTKEEALADLLNQAKNSYRDNKDSPNIGVASFQEYFSEQLRRMNLDQATAVKIWQQVLLFRRYFQDAGNESLVDVTTIKGVRQYANESLSVDLYKLPKALRIGDYEILQNFEAYLHAVTKQDKQNPLAVPHEYLPLAQIQKKYPELIEKKYGLEIKKVSQADLLAKISLRDLWNWEGEEKNWLILQQAFPILGGKKGKDENSRSESLEELDAATRSKVDAFAKSEILKTHPEWIEEAFSKAQPEIISISLREEGGATPFVGLDTKEQRQAFAALLESAPLGEIPALGSPLANYSPDKKTFYQIKVISRAEKPEILTFAQAQKDGTLKALNTKLLEKYYLAIREQSPSLYKEKNEWKALASIKEQIADKYYEKVLQALREKQKTIDSSEKTKEKNNDQLANLRLYWYVEEIKEKLKNNPSETSHLLLEKEDGKEPVLADQWKLEKSRETISREKNPFTEDFTKLTMLEPTEWSKIKFSPTGELTFFQLANKENSAVENVAIAEQMREIHQLIAQEAQIELMKHTLEKLKEKKAFSSSYLKKLDEEVKEGV